jgi:hypothetical protein
MSEYQVQIIIFKIFCRIYYKITTFVFRFLTE